MKLLRKSKKILKDERANLVIEASFVMTIAVVMVVVLINLGFIVYQQTLIESTANYTAANIANVYSSVCRDPEFGYVNDTNFYKTNLYRYITNAFTSSMDDKAVRKGEWFTLYRIKKNSLIKDEPKSVTVNTVRRQGSLLLNQVVVTIKCEYSIPLTKIWGGNNKMTFSATSKANCIDLLDYFDTFMMLEDDVIKKLDKFASTFTKFINTFDFSSLVK